MPTMVYHERCPFGEGESLNSSISEIVSNASTYDSGRGSSVMAANRSDGRQRPLPEGQDNGMTTTLWDDPIPEGECDYYQ